MKIPETKRKGAKRKKVHDCPKLHELTKWLAIGLPGTMWPRTVWRPNETNYSCYNFLVSIILCIHRRQTISIWLLVCGECKSWVKEFSGKPWYSGLRTAVFQPADRMISSAKPRHDVATTERVFSHFAHPPPPHHHPHPRLAVPSGFYEVPFQLQNLHYFFFHMYSVPKLTCKEFKSSSTRELGSCCGCQWFHLSPHCLGPLAAWSSLLSRYLSKKKKSKADHFTSTCPFSWDFFLGINCHLTPIPGLSMWMAVVSHESSRNCGVSTPSCTKDPLKGSRVYDEFSASQPPLLHSRTWSLSHPRYN